MALGRRHRRDAPSFSRFSSLSNGAFRRADPARRASFAIPILLSGASVVLLQPMSYAGVFVFGSVYLQRVSGLRSARRRTRVPPLDARYVVRRGAVDDADRARDRRPPDGHRHGRHDGCRRSDLAPHAAAAPSYWAIFFPATCIGAFGGMLAYQSGMIAGLAHVEDADEGSASAALSFALQLGIGFGVAFGAAAQELAKSNAARAQRRHLSRRWRAACRRILLVVARVWRRMSRRRLGSAPCGNGRNSAAPLRGVRQTAPPNFGQELDGVASWRLCVARSAVFVLTGSGYRRRADCRPFAASGAYGATIASKNSLRRKALRATRCSSGPGTTNEKPRISPPRRTPATSRSRSSRIRSADFTLATQNVDSLHLRAGSHNVLELHGDLREARCTELRRAPPARRDRPSARRNPARLRRSASGRTSSGSASRFRP